MSIHEEPGQGYWGILLANGHEHYLCATGVRTNPDDSLEVVDVAHGQTIIRARYEKGEWLSIAVGATLVDAMINAGTRRTPRFSFRAGRLETDSTRLIVNAVTQASFAATD